MSTEINDTTTSTTAGGRRSTENGATSTADTVVVADTTTTAITTTSSAGITARSTFRSNDEAAYNQLVHDQDKISKNMNDSTILAFIFVIVTTVVGIYLLNTNFHYYESCQMDTPIHLQYNITTGSTNNVDTTTTSKEYIVQQSCTVFSETYYEARTRFRTSVQELQKQYQEQVTLERIVVVPAKTTTTNNNNNNNNKNGDDDFDYTMDIAVLRGSKPGFIVHVSGVHGIEGYAGSAIQLVFLQLVLSKTIDITEDIPTIVLVHSFNPYGMAHYRRTNENNVDLNRNALRKEQWGIGYVMDHYNKELYDTYDIFFNPTVAPTWYDLNLRYWYNSFIAITRYGVYTLKGAMVGGQYHKPSGVFYGGGAHSNAHNNTIEASTIVLQQWFTKFFQQYPNLNTNDIATTWIDVHTGLGKLGEDTLLLPAEISYTKLQAGQTLENDSIQLNTWYPNSINGAPNATIESQKNNVFTSSLTGGSVQQGYSNIQGLNVEYYRHLFLAHEPNALVISQEFGTIPTPLVGRGLILENAAQQYSTSADEKLEWSKLTLIPAFYPQSSLWRKQILQKGIYVLQQSIHRTIKLSSSTSSTSTALSSSSSTLQEQDDTSQEETSTLEQVNDDESTATEETVPPHDEL